MKTTLISTFFTLLLFQLGLAQNTKGKIIDAATGESIPYANIRVNESENLVSNGEVYFTLSENNSQDATLLIISYLGFVNPRYRTNPFPATARILSCGTLSDTTKYSITLYETMSLRYLQTILILLFLPMVKITNKPRTNKNTTTSMIFNLLPEKST